MLSGPTYSLLTFPDRGGVPTRHQNRARDTGGRLAEQDKCMGNGAAGDAGGCMAGDKNLFAVHQRCAEAGVKQHRFVDAERLQGAGEVCRRGDIGSRAEGRAAIGQEAEKRPAAGIFGVVDLIPVNLWASGGSPVMHEPDPAKKRIGQAGEPSLQITLRPHL